MTRLSLVLCLLSSGGAHAQTTSISVKVLEGNSAINNISRRTAYSPVVQVFDAIDRPVARATVTFVVPANGPGARFSDGGTSSSVMTDEDGKAVAPKLTPNSSPGQFEIRVNAVYEGQTARATILQTNAAPLRASSGNTRKLLIIGLIGGAAAGGLLAATGGGSSSPAARPPAAPVPAPGIVTPGNPGFGPPQ